MKVNAKFEIILIAALLVTGAAIANAAPQTQRKSGERSERKETGEREAGESEQDQAALARQAKIGIDQARGTALKRAPGTVESSELEREHGKLVYSFDIRNAKQTIDEVQVSAITGRIVRVEHESKKQEATEKRKESQEKKR